MSNNCIWKKKSRNDAITELESDQQTTQPSSLFEIKNISKKLIQQANDDFDLISNISIKFFFLTYKVEN